MELDFQIRKRAAHLANTTETTLHAALIRARSDDKLFNRYFTTPTSLAAGAKAAAGRTAASSTTLPGTGGSAAGGASQQDLINQAVDRAVRAATKHLTGTHPAPKANPKKKKVKGGAKGAGGVKKAEKDKIHLGAMRAGKCIQHNKDSACKVFKCKWPHECSICDKKGCAAWKHAE